ncbi:MAG: GNAT family N-acetyltransferase [Acidimicrobiales bacterium]
MARVVDDLILRPATAADRAAVLELLASSLGWASDDRHAAFFAWKHDANPFGRSWAWVAEDPVAGVVGFRTFLRWRFERAGGQVDAVRAVDTATAVSHRGAGIFSRLTALGLATVTDAGVGFVFNTPNDQSRPGYVKLGWEVVGRLPVQLRPRSVRAVPRLARSRVAADLWSQSSDAGLPASDALEDSAGVERLLASQPPPTALRTVRTPAGLRWRYCGFAPLGYRAVLAGRSVEDGLALFRLRKRGRALECAVVEVLVPGGDRRASQRLARRALKVSGADHAIALAPEAAGGRWSGFVRTDRLGPVLTWRSATEPGPAPALSGWALSLGDIELF